MTQSITVTTIIERLIDMASSLEDAASRIYKIINSEGPSPEVLEKFFRQDIMNFKSLVERGKDSLLEFIANGRVELIPYKEFYIDAALQLDCIMSRLEAGTYRLLMLLSMDRAPSREVMEDVKGMLRELNTEASLLVDVLRASEVPPKDLAARRKLLDDKFSLAMEAEARADNVYREALARILTIYKDNAAEMMIFKEVIDAFEDAVDCGYSASTYGRLLGLAMLGWP